MTTSPPTTSPSSNDASSSSSSGCVTYGDGSLVVCFGRAVELRRGPDTRETRWCFHCRAHVVHERVIRSEQPYCGHCGRTIHWHVAGWLHDADNMATCLPATQQAGVWVGIDPVLSYYEPHLAIECTRCHGEHIYFPGCGPL